jgi:hypothetical protein
MAQEAVRPVVAILLLAACGGSSKGPGPAWLLDARIQTQGVGVANMDCRTGICQHNENTDLVAWNNALWLVHRTARSQILGPNSSLHVFRSTDGGKNFDDVAILQAPPDRDLRDPCFYQVGSDLYIKALTRLPVTSPRDSNVDTVAVGFKTSNGTDWTALNSIGPEQWSFWRIHQKDGVYYTVAYHDGDTQVTLFTSTDGLLWAQGPDVWTMSADTTVETEIQFQPDGTMLTLVRMDGNDQELLGDVGRLRTNVCVSKPPYNSFNCPMEIMGQRLDGPLAFFWNSRSFVVARKHLGADDRKRTSLFELTGDLSSGNIQVKEWGELPSAGDTSYAGAVPLDDHRVLVSWYSSDVKQDENWSSGLLDASDIWLGVIDFSVLK